MMKPLWNSCSFGADTGVASGESERRFWKE